MNSYVKSLTFSKVKVNSWGKIELELIVSCYFEMMSLELKGQPFTKASYRKRLLPLLNNRSEGSIEFKFQNISAVLIKLGQLYIKGYLPRFNYQKALETQVIKHITLTPEIELLFQAFVEKRIEPIQNIDFSKVLVEAPSPNTNIAAEPEVAYGRIPIKRNYLELEQKNTSLGLQGEEFVFDYEKWQLKKSSSGKLANSVRWVSKEEGDGLGFDILSRNPDGTDKYIEVKTTKLGKETPFYFTRNELSFSEENASNYHLYRLFDFEKKAKLFQKQGGLSMICHMTPVSYKGYF
ncbi:MAG: DUF3883 domain-containing protein [Cytophagales bacterium]|nr:DUF3883 domain-containing protein [Cytophagales bacterium]